MSHSEVCHSASDLPFFSLFKEKSCGIPLTRSFVLSAGAVRKLFRLHLSVFYFFFVRITLAS